MKQKYFIAIVPPEPILSDVHQIKKDISEIFGTRGALKSPAHITLHMPFLWDEDAEEKLIGCLTNFQQEVFLNINLNNFNCFEPRVIFVAVQENEELYKLQKKLVFHIKKNLLLFNQSDDLKGFHPHITVAFRDLKKPAFYSIWSLFKQKTFQRSFECRSLFLLKHTGLQWEIYKEFPFKQL